MKRISNLARKVDYFQLQKPSALFANHPINRLGVWRIADRIYGAGCKTPPKLKVISQVTGIHHNTWVLGGKEPLSRPAIVYFITPGTPPILKEANLEEMEKKSKLIKGAGRWPWV